MNLMSSSLSTSVPAASAAESRTSAIRLESAAFYIMLITAVLAPLAFWPTNYVSLDLGKALVIAFGTLASAVLCFIVALKRRSIELPPRGILVAGLLLVVSSVISAFSSGAISKSFFGQGFESSTASFFIVLMVAAWTIFVLIKRQPGRAIILYTGIVASFLVIYVFHLLRFIFGAGFASMSVFGSPTSSLFGSWSAGGAYAVAVGLIAILATIFLPLSRRIKIVYWILGALAAIGAFVVNDARVWGIAALVFLGITIYISATRPRSERAFFKALLRRIAWLPAAIFIVALILSLWGQLIARPMAVRMNAVSAEVTLPWQYTLDIAAGAVKAHPIVGVGPNRFGQAYIDYRPAIINSTPAWSLEFSSGWSQLSTLITNQGVLGLALWLLFLISFGLAGARALRSLPSDSRQRFIIVSSFTAASFLWLMGIVAPLPHVLFFFAFIMSGIFFGSAAAAGILEGLSIAPALGSRSYKFMPSVMAVLVIIAAVGGLMYLKKAAALLYFESGARELSTAGNAEAADAAFRKASSLDPSDLYWRARAEAGIIRAGGMIGSVDSTTPASTTQAVLAQVVAVLNDSVKYSLNAVNYDPLNYYNYLSQARVSAVAANLRMPQGYESAAQSYVNAIRLNRLNPSIYLSLAQLQASNNKLDDALQTLGAGLQVKNDYLDTIYLLSQVEAAKGNLSDAITAAQVAIQINPQSPILAFQLGLLKYNNKDYDGAAKAFDQAVKLQADYANARYFLGLSEARLSRNSEAIEQFRQLAASNPDNAEVKFILSNLLAGKSPFTNATPPITSAPEKRSSLPIQQK